MSRWRKIALAVGAVVGVVAIAMLAVVLAIKFPADPYAEGRKSSEWFDIALTNRFRSMEAERAIRSLGAKAVPYLHDKIKEEEPWVERYRKVLAKAPAFIQNRLTPPKNTDSVRLKAAECLGSIGPEARPALPDLLRMLKAEADASQANGKGSFAVIHQANVRRLAWAVGQIGSDDKDAVVALLEAARKSNLTLSVPVIGVTNTNLVPAFGKALADLLKASEDKSTERDALCYLYQWLLKADPDHPAALPVIERILRQPPDQYRLVDWPGTMAASKLAEIKGHEEEGIRLLLGCFLHMDTRWSKVAGRPVPPDVHRFAWNAFSGFVPERITNLVAHSPMALPQLCAALTNANPRIRAGMAFTFGLMPGLTNAPLARLEDMAAKDSSEAVRYYAANSLFKLAGRADLELTYKLRELNSAYSPVRLDAVEFLERHGKGSRSAIYALKQTAEIDADADVQHSAETALRALGAK